MMMKPLFKCHKILVHYSTNWGHMEEYWFLAPMSRLAISSASLNIFSETARCTGQQLGRSMKKTTSCKKATELPG